MKTTIAQLIATAKVDPSLVSPWSAKNQAGRARWIRKASKLEREQRTARGCR